MVIFISDICNVASTVCSGHSLPPESHSQIWCTLIHLPYTRFDYNCLNPPHPGLVSKGTAPLHSVVQGSDVAFCMEKHLPSVWFGFQLPRIAFS